MAANRYLKPSDFRKFLEANLKEPVGLTMDSRGCPISTYLEQETKRTWHVSTRICVPQTDEAGEDEFSTPSWARKFISTLDAQYASPTMVVGEEALYILNEI